MIAFATFLLAAVLATAQGAPARRSAGAAEQTITETVAAPSLGLPKTWVGPPWLGPKQCKSPVATWNKIIRRSFCIKKCDARAKKHGYTSGAFCCAYSSKLKRCHVAADNDAESALGVSWKRRLHFPTSTTPASSTPVIAASSSSSSSSSSNSTSTVVATYDDGYPDWCQHAGGTIAHDHTVMEFNPSQTECEQHCTRNVDCTAYSYKINAPDWFENIIAFCQINKDDTSCTWHEKCRIFTLSDIAPGTDTTLEDRSIYANLSFDSKGMMATGNGCFRKQTP